MNTKTKALMTGLLAWLVTAQADAALFMSCNKDFILGSTTLSATFRWTTFDESYPIGVQFIPLGHIVHPFADFNA